MRTRARIALVAAVVLIAAIAWPLLRELYWRWQPDAAFAAVTGRDLPPEVRATAYRGRIDDAFFHVTRYWMLSGDAGALRQVVVGTPFERSDDDARHMLPGIETALGVPALGPEVVVGYEWELPRNRWYLILERESVALYVH